MNGPRLGVGSEKVGGGVMKRIDVECSSEHVTAPRFSCSQSVHRLRWIGCGGSAGMAVLRFQPSKMAHFETVSPKKAQAFAITLPFAFYGLDGALVADGRR